LYDDNATHPLSKSAPPTATVQQQSQSKHWQTHRFLVDYFEQKTRYCFKTNKISYLNLARKGSLREKFQKDQGRMLEVTTYVLRIIHIANTFVN